MVVAYEVTGISPQSMTLPQKLKGFDAIGLKNGVSHVERILERATYTL